MRKKDEKEMVIDCLNTIDKIKNSDALCTIGDYAYANKNKIDARNNANNIGNDFKTGFGI